jgi:hypothetical protein
MGRNHGVLRNFANNGNDAYVSSGGNTSLLLRNQFNAQFNRVDINTVSLSTQTRFSVSTWANLSSIVPNPFGAGIFCWGNFGQYNSDVFLFVDSNGIVSIQVNNGVDGGANTTSSLPVGSWVHVAVVFNGSGTTNAERMKLHINGIEQTLSFTGYTVPSSTATLSNTVFRLGAYLDPGETSAYQWNGFLDDFILFDRNTALTANEVRFIYDQGRGGGMLREPPRRRSVFVPTLPFPVRRRSSRFLTFPG